MTAPHRFLLLGAIAICAVAAFACGGDDDDDSTATPGDPTHASSTTTPDAEPTVNDIIRELDLQALPEVQDLMNESGGQFVQTDVIYVDLTDDGIQEAVVPLSSEGTIGVVAFTVLTPDGDGASALVTVEAGGAGMAVDVGEDGRLVQTEPVPGPDDPECCPSMLRRTIYAWNGTALAIASTTTEPNPDLGSKTPSSVQP